MALIYTFDQALSDSEIWSSVDRRRKPLETWFGGCERSPLRKRSTSRVGGSSPRGSRRAKGWVRKPRPSVHRECSAYHDRVVVRECVSILCPGQSRKSLPEVVELESGKSPPPKRSGGRSSSERCGRNPVAKRGVCPWIASRSRPGGRSSAYVRCLRKGARDAVERRSPVSVERDTSRLEAG